MKLIIGWDPQDKQQVALTWGWWLARELPAQVEVVSVVPPLPGGPGLLTGKADLTALDRERKEERAEMAREGAVQITGRGSAPSLEIRVGQPARELKARGDEVEGSVLVVGSGNRKWFEALTGTTADRLLRLSARPVFVAKGSVPEGIGRILAPVDLSSQSESVVKEAARWAQGLEAELLLFHLPRREWSAAFMAGEVSHRDPAAMEDPERARSRAFTALEELAEGVRSEYPELSVRVEVGEDGGLAADGILARLESGQVGLLVTGTHGVGFLDRMILGSVAESVIQRAPCPVLVVPAQTNIGDEEA